MKIDIKAVKDIIQWDIRSWAPSLSFWQQCLPVDAKGRRALEIGSRDGGGALWLALQGYQVDCTDLDGPSDEARKLHERYGVAELVDYSSLNVLKPGEDGTYDVIMFKSVVGGVGRFDNHEAKQQMMDNIFRMLKPGGILVFAENLQASPLHRYFRKKFVRWGNAWSYVTVKEMREYMKDFNAIKVHSTGFLAAFGRNEFQRNVLAWFDLYLVNFLVPASWHYLMFCCANKPAANSKERNA